MNDCRGVCTISVMTIKNCSYCIPLGPKRRKKSFDTKFMKIRNKYYFY